MLVRGNNVIGLNVITLAEGKNIDTVKDIVYDPLENKVKALVLDEGGWFSDTKVLLIEDIHSIGRDAVIIENENKIKSASQVTGRIANIAKSDQELTQTTIFTDSGNELGKVSDVLFNPRTGRVEEFEVSQGLRDIQSGRKTVKIPHILTVGEDATIVSGVTESEFERQAKERGIQGSINQAVSNVQERTPQVLEQIKLDARNFWSQAQEKVGEYTSKTAEHADNLRQNVSQKAEDLRDDPRAQTYKERAEQVLREYQHDLEALASMAKTQIDRLGNEFSQKREEISRPENIEKTKELMQEQVSMAGHKMQNITDKAVDQAKQTASQMQQKAKETGKSIKEQPAASKLEKLSPERYQAYAHQVSIDENLKSETDNKSRGAKQKNEDEKNMKTNKEQLNKGKSQAQYHQVVGYANPIQVQKYLKGLDYPASKKQIIDKARSAGADERVMSTLDRIADRQYEGPTGVVEEIGKFE